MRDDFKISVVTPVFCAEEYINDAIDSVIEQTIGFGRKYTINIGERWKP